MQNSQLDHLSAPDIPAIPKPRSIEEIGETILSLSPKSKLRELVFEGQPTTIRECIDRMRVDAFVVFAALSRSEEGSRREKIKVFASALDELETCTKINGTDELYKPFERLRTRLQQLTLIDEN